MQLLSRRWGCIDWASSRNWRGMGMTMKIRMTMGMTMEIRMTMGMKIRIGMNYLKEYGEHGRYTGGAGPAGAGRAQTQPADGDKDLTNTG